MISDDECLKMKQELTGDNRRWLVHPKIILVSKEELVKHQLRWILDEVTGKDGTPLKVNDSELSVLAYVYLYGIEAAEHCVKDGLYTSIKTVENCITKFRKETVILGTREDTRLNDGIKLSEGNISLTIKYKLKNGS